MFTPYNPCTECKHKGEKCVKCAFQAAHTNYQRALKEIIKLKTRLNESITILK